MLFRSSSQAGCAVNCSFCSTGKQGFSRNLNTAEILGQIWLANQLLRQPGAQPRWGGADDMAQLDEDVDDAGALRPISNIVFIAAGYAGPQPLQPGNPTGHTNRLYRSPLLRLAAG